VTSRHAGAPHLLSFGIVLASYPVQAGLLGVKVAGLRVVVIGAQVNMVGLQARRGSNSYGNG
jgi:hypothetical protein